MADKSNEALKKNIELVDKAQKQYNELYSQLMKNVTQIHELTSVTTNLNKQLKNATSIKAFNNAQRELKANIKSVSLAEQENIKITSLLAREQQKLAREELKTAQQEEKLANSTKLLNGEYQKASRELTKLRNHAKNVALQFGLNSKEFKKAAAELRKLDTTMKKVDAALGQYGRSVGNYRNAVGGLGNSLRGLAGAFGFVGAVQLFANALKNGFNQIKEFEKSSAVLAGVLGKTRKEIKALSDDARRLGGVTAKTSNEIVGLQTAYARLGFSQEEILDLTGDTINGSIALNAQLDETAELTGAVVRTFDDLSTTDAGAILDQMTLSTQRSALNFEKLQTALPIVAGAANTAGISFTKLLGLLGKLSDSGIDASSSATALRNIFIESAAQGLNYEQILQKIVSEQDKLTAANDEFGKRAAVSATILAKNIQGVNDLDKALQNAGGTAKKVADEQLKTLDGKITLLTSAWQGFIDSLNGSDGVISKTFSNITEGITSNIQKLTRLNTTFEELVSIGVSDRFDDIKKSLRGMGDEIKTGEDIRKQLIKFLSSYESASKNVSKELDELGGKTGIFDEIKTALNIDSEIKNQRDLLQLLGEEYSGVVDSIKELLLAQNDDVFNEFAASILKQNTAISKNEETTTELIEKETDLIKIQEKLLAQAKELPGSTEQEIQFRQAKIRIIEKEIERLKSLGTQQEALKGKTDVEGATPALDIDKIGEEQIAKLKARTDKEVEIVKEGEKKKAEARKQWTEVGFDAANTIANTYFDIAGMRRDAETEAEVLALQDRLNNESLDAEQREAIQAELAEKEKKIRRDKAKADKKAALIQSVINTALSIGKTAATVGFPAAIPLIAIAAALGLAQQVAIASQPIPQFDKGVKNAPDGGFIAGEKRPEFMIHKGNVSLVDRPTLFGGEYKGAEIISGSETGRIIDQIQRAQVIDNVSDYNNDERRMISIAVGKEFEKYSDKIVKELRNNRTDDTVGVDSMKRTLEYIKKHAE